MRRRALSLALASAIGLIALLSLLSGAAAGDSGGSSGAPPSLTHHFPLGTQTLSSTKTGSAGGAGTTPRGASATSPDQGSTATPHQGSSATPHRTRSTQAVRKHDAHGTSSALFLLVIPVLIGVALLVRAARRTGRRDRAGVRRRRARWTRSPSHGARWAYQNQDEPEHQPPALPLRRRAD